MYDDEILRKTLTDQDKPRRKSIDYFDRREARVFWSYFTVTRCATIAAGVALIWWGLR